MQTVILKPLRHRENECIGIYFSAQLSLQTVIQKQLCAAWSRTHKCWYVPYTQTVFERVLQLLSAQENTYTRVCGSFPERQTLISKSAEPVSPGGTARISRFCRENQEALRLFRQHLSLKGYSVSTIRTYTNEFIQFLDILQEKPAADLTEDRLKDYIHYCHDELKLSESTIHSRMNALKFYYEQLLGKEKFFWRIPRPKKPLLLPKVFSKEQVAKLINSIENHKHKTMIMLTYGCGLRVSEVVSLKIKDVDGQRKLLFVRKAKGKKDRVVSLSPAMLVMLREYYKRYKPRDFLFEGQYKDEHLSARSIQNVLRLAKQKAGIKQDGNMHVLRHSFATHLLDKGIDVVFIQKLLGHNDIKTTLKYLHVTNKDLVQIISPLDDIEGLLKK